MKGLHNIDVSNVIMWKYWFLYILVFIMDEIKKLLGDINEKNEQNKQFEKEKSDSEYQVEEQQKHINMKLNLLKRHYKEEKKYDVKLQEDISMLKNKREKLDKQEEILDREVALKLGNC